MAKWEMRTLKLQKNHGWTAKPGFKIFVAGRGAVRFDIPRHWTMEPESDSVKFRDKPEPDDDCLLQMSWLHLSPEVNWNDLPLAQLLEAALKGDTRGPLWSSDTKHVDRQDLEVAWREMAFIDPEQNREATSRAALARAKFNPPNVPRDVPPGPPQAFITMDFWPEHTGRFGLVWDEVLRSLQLGIYVKDPTKRALA